MLCELSRPSFKRSKTNVYGKEVCNTNKSPGRACAWTLEALLWNVYILNFEIQPASSRCCSDIILKTQADLEVHNHVKCNVATNGLRRKWLWHCWFALIQLLELVNALKMRTNWSVQWQHSFSGDNTAKWNLLQESSKAFSWTHHKASVHTRKWAQNNTFSALPMTGTITSHKKTSANFHK